MIRHEDFGRGKPLLLVHGIGSSGHAWQPVLAPLSEARRVLVIDLPAHGLSPAEADSGTFAGLVRSVSAWMDEMGMTGIDMVGSSLGARIVLELARRGLAGHVVALDPGGFWEGWERQYAVASLSASRALVKGVKAAIPALAGNPLSRSLLLAQLSARPWALDGKFVAEELRTLAETPTVSSLIQDLGYGPGQEGSATTDGRLAIGWGRHDRLCLPAQAKRAAERFPSARLHWFEHSGHFPLWDEPAETVKLIGEVCG
jgi:pimeloyl-ACP methyl ester carboxylesterase